MGIGSDFFILETWIVLLMFFEAFCVILVKKYPETKKIKIMTKFPKTTSFLFLKNHRKSEKNRIETGKKPKYSGGASLYV